MPKVTVVAIHVAKPGSEADLEAALKELIAPTREEAGFIQYDLHRDLDEPRRFLFFELWESRELLQQHSKSDHLANFRQKAGGWIEQSQLHILEQIG